MLGNKSYATTSFSTVGLNNDLRVKVKRESSSEEEQILFESSYGSIKAVQKETGIKGKNLFMPIRIAVSGEMHGPELPETIFLLGREKSIKHIDQVLATL